MMRPVLFASTRPLGRAENITAIYGAYDGPKTFVQVDPWRRHPEIISGNYGLMVIDEFPTVSPGKIILVGHCIEGGKTGGLDQPHPYYHAHQASLITWNVTTSPDMVPLAATQSGLPESQVLPLGLPRTDAYVGRKKGDGHTRLAGKRAYLYAPTYRSKEETPLPNIDWAWLDNAMTDDEVLVVKAHMMTGRILQGQYRHIIEVSPDEPSAPYLIDCDVVITDYSSIIFDGYLLGKPSVLIEKVRGYTTDRGMYLLYPEQYSSMYCKDEKTMLELVRKADGLGQTERECIRHVAEACDGHATERVCELIRRECDA